MRLGQIHSISKLSSRRSDLRKTLTPAEAALWTLLKSNQLKGRKFRKQHSIEYFIVDFYCAEEKLIVELDGQVHNDPGQAEYDARRDERLRALGYAVLRFENKLVFQQTAAVLYAIESAFRKLE